MCWKRYSGWEMALFAIGWASFISVIVILLLPIGKGPQLKASASAMPPVTSPAFLKIISHSMAVPIDQGPPVETLTDGDAFVRALIRDIDGAQHSINFMVYIWEDGNFNDMVLAHLERKQRQGVQVRVMLDAYGAQKAPNGKLQRLEQAGGKVATFRSLVPLPWNILRNTKRNHRRAIVVDGVTGYTGGIAVADTYGTDAFLRDFDMYFCKLFDGARHDSGDPFEWGEKLIAHYQKNRVDPRTKTLIFSDQLSFPLAIEISRRFRGRAKISFGIGTNLTNDLGYVPINIVIKMTECNGQPVAKVSDAPGKTISKDEGYLTYLRQVYGIPAPH